jgi:ABC-2 type transport system ATP-binding protein
MYPLEVKNLRKEFLVKNKLQVAVDNVSFHVGSGEIVGLLGPNGAGKSSTIFMLLGVLTPSAGEVRYFSKKLSESKSEIMQRVGYVSGYARLPWNLSVRENLEWTAALYGIPRQKRRARIDELLERFSLGEHATKRAGFLSAGQVTRAMLAKAFMHEPELVLLDEPTASLDPEVAHEVRRFVLEHARERKVSMLFTSHNMDEVSAVCDRVIFLRAGKVLAEGTPTQLARLASQTELLLQVRQGEALVHSLAAQFNAELRQEAASQLRVFLAHEKVGPFISALGNQGVVLREIEIKKPTLEDYFIQVAAGENSQRDSSGDLQRNSAAGAVPAAA